jgi:hypothetical protein
MLAKIKLTNANQEQVVIYCDSQAALKALANPPGRNSSRNIIIDTFQRLKTSNLIIRRFE